MTDKTNIIQISIPSLPIRLGQFLKHADLVADGLQAKIIIQSGEVLVNGAIETRRGRQLKSGDIVKYNDLKCQVK